MKAEHTCAQTRSVNDFTPCPACSAPVKFEWTFIQPLASAPLPGYATASLTGFSVITIPGTARPL